MKSLKNIFLIAALLGILCPFIYSSENMVDEPQPTTSSSSSSDSAAQVHKKRGASCFAQEKVRAEKRKKSESIEAESSASKSFPRISQQDIEMNEPEPQAAAASSSSQPPLEQYQQVLAEEEAASVEPFATHGLLIFLDDSEKKNGAISQSLSIAIKQQAAPILASTYLVNNIPQNLLNSWLIKITDSSGRLLLMIPKNYKNKFTHLDLTNYQSYQKLGPTDPFTEIEYQLGLKIDHMENHQSLSQNLSAEKDSFYFPEALWNFHTLKSNIFISLNEYRSKNKDLEKFSAYKVPQWAIFLNGHGGIGRLIGGLTLRNFNSFLGFLQSITNTSLLFYVSCYAIGTNTELMFKDPLGVNKYYPFIIVTSGLTDDVTYLHSSNLDFNKFIANMTTTPVTDDFHKALLPLLPPRSAGKFLNSLPFIKLPKLEWFKLFDYKHEFAIIGNTFAQTCKSVKISKYFRKKGYETIYCLLYAPIIPCELNIDPDIDTDIDTDRFEEELLFLPMAKKYESSTSKGKRVYYFKKISAFSLYRILNAFSAIDTSFYNDDWAILIEEVQVDKDDWFTTIEPSKIDCNEKATLSQFVITKGDTRLHPIVYFTYNNKIYTINFHYVASENYDEEIEMEDVTSAPETRIAELKEHLKPEYVKLLPLFSNVKNAPIFKKREQIKLLEEALAKKLASEKKDIENEHTRKKTKYDSAHQ